ncbi:MAG TPA: thioredoxin family protein [Candidatus Acidoferrales bacterium]|nr:thioredoxin family protein [Candidatus Acidoferrales bacterium]
MGAVLAALLVCAAMASAAQAQGSSAAESFAPLETWKAAVLSGDAAALRALYSTEPPATLRTPKGDDPNPAAEPDFWSALKPVGLERLDTKILRIQSPQPGVQSVMFTLEATLRVNDGITKRFATIAQYWMDENSKPLIVATARSYLGTMPQPVESKPDLYPDPTEARTDIGLGLAVAKREHKRVLLDFGGNWCYDCHVLDASFHYPAIERILDPNYVVVHINIGQYDKNLDLAGKYQIPLKKGVPSLAVLDANGNLLVSQKQGDFENTTKIAPKDVENFLEKWKP